MYAHVSGSETHVTRTAITKNKFLTPAKYAAPVEHGATTVQPNSRSNRELHERKTLQLSITQVRRNTLNTSGAIPDRTAGKNSSRHHLQNRSHPGHLLRHT